MTELVLVGIIGLGLGLILGTYLGFRLVAWLVSLAVAGGLEMLRAGVSWRSIGRQALGVSEEAGLEAQVEQQEDYGDLGAEDMEAPPGVME